MSFLAQKINGLKKRLICFYYGITYLQSNDFAIPSLLKINGKKKQLNFVNPNDNSFVYEFTEICLNDCYQLAKLKNKLGNVKTIVDIGANQGLFSIAARQHFETAVLTCYEPNSALCPFLTANAVQLKAQVFYEAVTKEDCRINLQFGESDLHTVAKQADAGNVTGTAFKKVIERTGGKIDILKMDCEGGEWAIMEDKTSWANVRAVTMEYHLWAKAGSSAEQVEQILNELGFTIIANDKLSDQFGLLTAIKN